MLKVGSFFTPQISATYSQSENQKYAKLNHLNADTVSFGAMKKRDFEGFDAACVNMFKAPIEKFTQKSDLTDWASKKLEEKYNLDNYKAINAEDDKERKKRLIEWKLYLTQTNDIYRTNPVLSLIIFHSITKDLTSDNRKLPPVLQPRVLADTMTQISQNLKKDKNCQFDFNKIYRNKLRLFAMGSTKRQTSPEAVTKWVKIPSYYNDPDNFEKNVKRLKMLSHDSWCTKSFNAEPYLRKGDFYIYLEKGQPKAAIRMVGEEIQEIQGEKNNGIVPWQYAEIISCFIKEKGLDDYKVKDNIHEAKAKELGIKKLKHLSETTDEPTPKQIFSAMGILEEINEDGTYTLSHFGDFDEDIPIQYLKIDQNKLFENVSKISGNAVFGNADVTDLKNLEYIGGDADFEGSKVKTTPKLKIIGKDANFSNSLIENIDSLEKIGGNCYLFNSKLKSLGKVKMISGNFTAVNTPLESLGELMSVKGDFLLTKVPLKSPGNLQFIGGNFGVKDSITTLGKIKTIKGNADLAGIKDIGDLKNIGGNASFANSEINDTKNLEKIGKIADFRNSKVKSVPNLKYVGQNVWVDKDIELDFSQVEIDGKIFSIG